MVSAQTAVDCLLASPRSLHGRNRSLSSTVKSPAKTPPRRGPFHPAPTTVLNFVVHPAARPRSATGNPYLQKSFLHRLGHGPESGSHQLFRFSPFNGNRTAAATFAPVHPVHVAQFHWCPGAEAFRWICPFHLYKFFHRLPVLKTTPSCASSISSCSAASATVTAVQWNKLPCTHNGVHHCASAGIHSRFTFQARRQCTATLSPGLLIAERHLSAWAMQFASIFID